MMTTPVSSRPTRTTTIVASILAAAALVAGVATVPKPPHLSTDTRGNAALISTATPLLKKNGVLDHAAVAVIDHDKVTTADWGTTDETTFEIGSVTKTMTAALYEDAISRGEVTRDTRLGALLPLGDSAASKVTLDSIATQTSGLPALPPSGTSSLIAASATGRDPYRNYTTKDLIAQAKVTPLGKPGKYVYSNLGFALLGQAIAAKAGTPYGQLVKERLLDPVGMHDTTIATTADKALHGHGWTASGRPAEPWILNGYAPAGAAHSTLQDLTTYTKALMASTSPGVRSTEPRKQVTAAAKIGSAWFTIKANTETGTAIYHNGETGGYSSIIMFNRQEQRGVVIVTNTAVLLDPTAKALLTGKSN